LLPFEPPIQSAALPSTGGQLGPDPEDFQVDEVPLYACSGSGQHRFVRLEKRTLTTPELVVLVARQARIPERDVGYAGLKDKHAVTTQWLSLPASSAAPESWKLPDSVEVLETALHDNKLRTGHLRANRFRIRLVGVTEGALGHAEAIASQLEEEKLLNFFGAQRFGWAGSNLERAVLAISGAQVKARPARFWAKFSPSVVQAELFNRYLVARARLGLGRLFAGEVVRLTRSGATFRVEDTEREEFRLKAGELTLVGPILGSTTKLTSEPLVPLVEEALAALGITFENLRALGKHAQGTIRDLLVPVRPLELQANSGSLVLSFTLPSGSYATQVIREFTRAPFFLPHSERAQEAELSG
jgi:tRNA pseudouridine13 synthase